MRDSVLPPDTAAMRVTIITLDHHALGPVMKAEERLRADMPGVRITAHAAAEWAENPEALEAARADVAQANVIVANLLFIDEHIKAILPFIEARRDAADAVVACVSAQEVVAQTKMGELDMSVPSNGLVGLLKKLRGSKKPGASSSQKQMAILRRLPRILRFIPGKAQDLRAYFLAMQYWLAGSEDNVEAMLRFLVDKYATGERAGYRGVLKHAAPVVYPDVGLYHPDLPERITEYADALPGPSEPVATVGLLLMRSYVLAGDTGHYDSVIRAFEAAGVKVVPTFAGGLDGRPAIETYLKQGGVACVDACVSLTGFSLVGGPAYNDSEAAVEVLKDLDLPYITAHPIEFQTLEKWKASSGGLSPVETTILVALPELDGGISPIVFGGRHGPGAETGKAMAPCPERIDMLVARATKLAKLRRSRVTERKVAVVLYGFPPNAGAIGTAAYMSVFESLFNTLNAMKAEGYAFDLPDSVDMLRADILEGNAAQMGQEANVAAIIPADRIVAEDPYLNEIEAVWGPAPGKALSDGRGVFVLGKQYGNVMVGVQPTFGYEGDPMRLLFENGFAPTHAFNGFYRYLRQDFGADAVLHFGMHGALEFMPGKQAGMSGACWPDRLIGDLPNIYLYAANNPSEGTLAKRRSNAILVSHLTPPVGKAGLYKGLLDLKDTLDVWRKTPVVERRAEMAETLQAQAAELDLAAPEPLWAEPEAEIDALRARLHEYEQSLIPSGLHVVGKPPEGEAKADLLASMAEVDGATEESLAEAARLIGEDHEIPGLLRALGGHYIAPVPGGDLLRSPQILPTGRNIHAFDPYRMPSAFALEDGARQAEKLLAKYSEAGEPMPRSVAMVLWGADNIKSDGGPIAQALGLMGARPRFDGYGRLAGAELISLEALERPRVDVVMTLSGIFRDLLPLQIKMLAEAAWLASEADEPAGMNPIRAHTLSYMERDGTDFDTAALRVFSNAEGAYGSNVNALLDSGAWDCEDELADAYETRKGFAYGRDGKSSDGRAHLKSMLGHVDLAYQNLESVELGVTTVDHYFDTLGGIGRAVKRAKGGAEAPVFIGDQTRGDGKVRTLNEQVALETRTRTLNPKWFESLMTHGHEGVRQIEAQVTNTMGWSATTGQVDEWVYKRMTETFVLDQEMRQRLAELNPQSASRMAQRLIEAVDRNYWEPTPEMLEALYDSADELEDRLEGVFAAEAAE